MMQKNKVTMLITYCLICAYCVRLHYIKTVRVEIGARNNFLQICSKDLFIFNRILPPLILLPVDPAQHGSKRLKTALSMYTQFYRLTKTIVDRKQCCCSCIKGAGKCEQYYME